MASKLTKIAPAAALTLSCIALVATQALPEKISGTSLPATVTAKKANPKPAGGGPKTPTTAKATAYSGPPVLDPSQFFGEAALGYASAKACPEVVAKVFCYCGCDISDSHDSLLDCYTGLHGTDCHICQEEAVLALRMSRNGSSIAEIQKEIDETYSKKYPFQEESPALKRYKASRLWKPESAATSSSKPQPTPAEAASVKGSATATDSPKVKPGFHPGNCCQKEHAKAPQSKK